MSRKLGSSCSVLHAHHFGLGNMALPVVRACRWSAIACASSKSVTPQQVGLRLVAVPMCKPFHQLAVIQRCGLTAVQRAVRAISTRICGYKEQLTMSGELVADLRHALDVVGESVADIPYLVRVVGLCIVCATIADDIRDKYLLHFWVRSSCVSIEAEAHTKHTGCADDPVSHLSFKRCTTVHARVYLTMHLKTRRQSEPLQAT